jgi:hypothetical protein
MLHWQLNHPIFAQLFLLYFSRNTQRPLELGNARPLATAARLNWIGSFRIIGKSQRRNIIKRIKKKKKKKGSKKMGREKRRKSRRPWTRVSAEREREIGRERERKRERERERES